MFNFHWGEMGRRVTALFRRRSMDREVEEELSFHLEMKARETGDAAAARCAVGNSLALRERARDAWGWRWIEEALLDGRYALRGLRRSPGFAIATIATLALGIGATCLVFSVANATILRPFPFRDPGRLVIVWSKAPRGGRFGPRFEDYSDWRANNQVFEDMAAETTAMFDIGEAPYPERMLGERVTANYFSAFGIAAEIGRTFLPEDERAGRLLLLLSDRLWRSRFGGNPAVIGSTISASMNGISGAYTIVGVLPPTIQEQFFKPREAWTLLQSDRQQVGVTARLKPGISLAAAESAMKALAAAPGSVMAPTGEPRTVELEPLESNLTGGARTVLPLLEIAAGLVLLIACVNVANLMLARGVERQKELTIRAAVGAGRRRLIRQLLTESLTLGILGGAAGTAIAFAGVRGARALAPASMLRHDNIAVDGWVLLFTLVVSLAAGLLFGILPALRAGKVQLQPGLAGFHGPRERTVIRSGLIVAEIALALILVMGAGLMIESLLRLAWKDVGFARENLLTLETGLPVPQYDDAQYRTAVERKIVTGLESLPGVRSAAITDLRPLGSYMYSSFRKAAGDEQLHAGLRGVTAGYFETMGIPLLRGRLFSPRDEQGSAQVALISEEAARQYWPGQEPVGKLILVQRSSDRVDVAREIVGVVGNTARMALAQKPGPEIYIPQSQGVSTSAMEIAIRIHPGVPQAAVIPAIRTELAAIDRTFAVEVVQTMQSVIDQQLAQPRFLTMLLGVFGALALLLTVSGVVGVVAYLVRARTYEFGVRMAMGATRANILGLILGYGGRLAMIGVGLGTAGALGLTRLLTSFLYEVKPTDAPLLSATAILLFAAVLAACYASGRKAMGIDPAQSLRHD
jgi:putative ABC transport system permease protein